MQPHSPIEMHVRWYNMQGVSRVLIRFRRYANRSKLAIRSAKQFLRFIEARSSPLNLEMQKEEKSAIPTPLRFHDSAKEKRSQSCAHGCLTSWKVPNDNSPCGRHRHESVVIRIRLEVKQWPTSGPCGEPATAGASDVLSESRSSKTQLRIWASEDLNCSRRAGALGLSPLCFCCAWSCVRMLDSSFAEGIDPQQQAKLCPPFLSLTPCCPSKHSGR